MIKAIFCDRDGVINKLVGSRGPWYPNEIQYYEGIEDSIKEAHEMGYHFIVVTNQPDITPNLNGTRLRIELQLQNWGIDHIEYSTERGADDYKPRPGMILRAKRRYNIDLSKSWMIGDTWKDSVCAALTKVRYLHCGKEEAIGPHIWVGNLKSAIGHIRLIDDFDQLEMSLEKK